MQIGFVCLAADPRRAGRPVAIQYAKQELVLDIEFNQLIVFPAGAASGIEEQADVWRCAERWRFTLRQDDDDFTIQRLKAAGKFREVLNGLPTSRTGGGMGEKDDLICNSFEVV